MKRFFLTVALCTSLLAVLSLFLFPTSQAAENPLLTLLNLPAPPPPNPQVPTGSTVYPDDFFNKSKPPPDDIPIDALMDYWRTQAQDYNDLRHRVYPSDKALERIMAEIEKDPGSITEFLNILPRGSRSSEFVKSIYDRMANSSEADRERRSFLKRWMRSNTPYFSSELARDAARVSDTEGYVTNHDALISLARVDWDRANPIVSRLYNNPGQKASRTAALWALYLHAIETGSPSDTERYRDELKETVADKSLSDGIRDLALDALSLEKEWSGRDEWYMSLMEDETLLELGTYTGLTTLITSSPEEKYIDRMLALLESDNINVRTAAARNLLLKIDPSRPHVIRALIPWLTNPKWLKENTRNRSSLVMALARVKIPEAVPALIVALDEKEQRAPFSSNLNAPTNVSRNAVTNAMATVNPVDADGSEHVSESMTNSPRSVRRTTVSNTPVGTVYDAVPSMVNTSNSYFSDEPVYPLRYWAITALTFQEDPRAVPALRRLLGEVHHPHEQNTLVAAILKCGGYSTGEQVDAIEDLAKHGDTIGLAGNANLASMANFSAMAYTLSNRSGTPGTDVKRILGSLLAQSTEVSEDLGRSVVDRITSLDRSDPATANVMRKIVLKWQGSAINALLLRDLKNRRTDADAIVRLLSVRRDLREKQQADVFDIRTGSPTAVGISACLLEQQSDLDAILNGASDEAKTAMLACARLIRATLSVRKVADSLQSRDKLLALAAERYLESDDSPEARSIVLALHPNEAVILGATTAFFPAATSDARNGLLQSLFASVTEQSAGYVFEIGQNEAIQTIEKRLQEEVRRDTNLLGIYNWSENYIRIYKDRAAVSWDEDTARYRERDLTKEEFENFKGLIAHYKADELPPFLNCGSGRGCVPKQLLMISRNGGRRVFMWSASPPPFFAELDRAFAQLRSSPAQIKYWAGKDVPGLEVLFADDRQDAMAVWKNAADFRLLVADRIQRAEIDSQLESFSEQLGDGEQITDDDPTVEDAVARERTKREYENYSWHSFAAGALGSTVNQPVDYIPLKDPFPVAARSDTWKARAGATEIRTDDKGLYKITAGKLTKIKSGVYRGPVVSPNGRWVVATKEDDDVGLRLVRVNLLTNREYVIDPGELSVDRAIAFVPSLNRILVGSYYDEYSERVEELDDAASDSGTYVLLDPETGSVIPARGEVRPLVQQSYRPLQPAANPFEFWAAIPRGEGTVVGIYNTRTFNLKPVLKLPKISFDSMNLWVDATESKIYFVYEGHLLAAPIKIASTR